MITFNEEREIFVALTRHNYFPNQKEYMGELPPCFDTRQFTPEVCTAISKLAIPKHRNDTAYDLSEYRATRYNNVPRVLGLIHPKPYSDLVCHMIDNWSKLRHIVDNGNSHIKPELRSDGRAFVMNYEDSVTKKRRVIQSCFSKRVKVTSDIANCFNSIYTHSIPWAIVGVENAKKNKRKGWYNQLDKNARTCKRGETLGVPIGSGTSSILVELVLVKIDEKLVNKGYNFERYIDDYTCYCDNDLQAENFIIDLGRLLSEYKLSLNLSKTNIINLPSPSDDDWVLEISSILPTKSSVLIDEERIDVYSTSQSLTFINQALKINERTPDGSVLKYALQLITNSLDDIAAETVFQETLNLSWHYPILIPFLEKLSSKYEINVEYYENQLNKIIIDNAKKRKSDGMCWPLFIMYTRGLTPTNETIEEVVSSEDCLAITMIVNFQGFPEPVKSFVDNLTNTDNYTKDNYWLLLYQSFFLNQITSPYDDEVFEKLKELDVNFLPDENITKSESECEKIAYELTFGMPDLTPTF